MFNRQHASVNKEASGTRADGAKDSGLLQRLSEDCSRAPTDVAVAMGCVVISMDG